jgi:integrase
MKTSLQPKTVATPEATGENIIPFALAPKPQKQLDQRFKIKPFVNPRTHTPSWRVEGIKRDGTRIRENCADEAKARCRQIELETEFLQGHVETAVRATRLTQEQIALAESAFARLDAEQELVMAVDYWLRHGRQNAVAESPRLDEAFANFCTWLAGTAELRELSRANLRRRVNVFVNSTSNVRVCDVTPEAIEAFLAKRDVSGTAKDNDRRAVSRFFSWCIERPRRWTASNPCREIRVSRGEKPAPEILSLEQCKGLLKAAENHKGGRLAPYVAASLFAGLRPWEVQSLKWDQVNLADREIRLEGTQTKTGNPRVVTICETLARWLKAYQGVPFYAENWRRDFDAIKEQIGFGTPTEAQRSLKPWTVDILRHTAISHYFRKTGSYGQTAEQFGNSEAIIKKHYQGRVSSEDTKAFYALLPMKGGRK